MSTGAVSGSDTPWELLPCPFCGNDELTVVDSCDFVACNECGAQIEDGEPNARVAWNTRADRAPAQLQNLTDEQINAAAEVMWNDRDARHGGPWSSRDPREIVVQQTKATARAALLAAQALTPAGSDDAAAADAILSKFKVTK